MTTLFGVLFVPMLKFDTSNALFCVLKPVPFAYYYISWPKLARWLLLLLFCVYLSGSILPPPRENLLGVCTGPGYIFAIVFGKTFSPVPLSTLNSSSICALYSYAPCTIVPFISLCLAALVWMIPLGFKPPCGCRPVLSASVFSRKYYCIYTGVNLEKSIWSALRPSNSVIFYSCSCDNLFASLSMNYGKRRSRCLTPYLVNAPNKSGSYFRIVEATLSTI